MNTNSESSYSSIIDLLKKDPAQGLEKLLQKRHLLRSPSSFWREYVAVVCSIQTDSQDAAIFSKLNTIHLLWQINATYTKAYDEKLAKIHAQKPSSKAIYQALFLSSELDVLGHPQLGYSFERLEAIKGVFRDLDSVSCTGTSAYSVELLNDAAQLISLKEDMVLVEEFLDYCLWGSFYCIADTENGGFKLIPEQSHKKENPYILNKIKLSLKRAHKQKHAAKHVSEEKHFQAVDEKWKTNEGLALMLHTGGIKVSTQQKGITSLEIPDDFFDDLTSDDPVKRNIATVKTLLTGLTQQFHFRVRTALEEIYFPGDTIDLHKYTLSINASKTISVYELLTVTAGLYAYALNLRYCDQLNGLDTLFHNFCVNLKAKNELPENALEVFKATIAHNFEEMMGKKKYSPLSNTDQKT